MSKTSNGANTSESWLACPDCDLLHRPASVPVGGAARCRRCRAVLYRERAEPVDRTVALAVAAAVLFAVANALPFLGFEMRGLTTETTLATGVDRLWQEGHPFLASVVFATAIGAPGLQIALLLYVLVPLRLGRRPPQLARAFRLLRRVQPWSMMEVFLIGILVSLVKLADMATLVPGIALAAFALLIPVLAGAAATLEARAIWRAVDATGWEADAGAPARRLAPGADAP